jgi:membrane-associated protein
VEQLIDIFRHLPEYLQVWAQSYGAGLYLILGLIIFAETGLVVTPLLPGDSLLFATGAILATGLPGLSLPVMCLVLIAAAFCGDLVNYHVGKWAAPRIFESGKLKWLNRKHLEKTQDFFARHGGKTIILARFLPIVRTYAPFVAGLGGFTLRRFIAFSLTGGALWITLFLHLGYFFGNIPFVKKNFELVIVAIIVVSLAPVVIEFFRSRVKGHSGTAKHRPL